MPGMCRRRLLKGALFTGSLVVGVEALADAMEAHILAGSYRAWPSGDKVFVSVGFTEAEFRRLTRVPDDRAV